MGNYIEINGKVISKGIQPLICTPVTGTSKDRILSELQNIMQKKPDLIEWRVDYFEKIANIKEVIDISQEIKNIVFSTPVIFTRRSLKEGGQPINLSEDKVVEMYAAICESRNVDIIDFELNNNADHFQYLRKKSAENNIKMIGSYHNFESTPDLDFIVQKLAFAQHIGADIGKIAVMPNHLEDVLTILQATLTAKNKLEIPIITMSMGEYGSLSRMIGGIFGSAITFAIGEYSSAPGQVPIEDLRTVLAIIQKSFGNQLAFGEKQ